LLNQKMRERAYLLALLDACLLWIAFLTAFWIRLMLPELIWNRAAPIDFASHVWAVLVAIPLYALFAGPAGLYSGLETISYRRLFVSIARVFVYVGLIIGLAIFLLQTKSFSRTFFFLFIGIGFTFCASSKLFLKAFARRMGERPADIRNVLIVGVNPDAREVQSKLESNPLYGLKVAGYLTGPGETADGAGSAPVLGTLSELRRIVGERVIDEVVFALPFSKLLDCEEQIAWCEEIGTTVHLKVDFVRSLLSKMYPSDLEGTPMLTLASTPRDPVSLAVKRALDIVVSGVALVVLSPVIVGGAVLVALTSRGPVLFRQNRIGLNGRLFTLYKFRSMRSDAEARKHELAAFNEMSGPVFKMKNDPRVTFVGRWLRRFSVDELPQLWNVLVGDLSLVGPRPPTPDEVERYERWQRRRLSVKPGVTCLWQVSGRNEIDFEDWMKLDLQYIDSWSLKLDLKILLRTIPAVLSARGSR
jgi:exopolysaccharide biosynthesis polyprenyl glycosylphosphotransferase